MYNSFEKIVSNFDMEYIKNNIKSRKVIVWGAGYGGKIVYNLLKSNNISIYKFIDKDIKKINLLFQGLKVESPQYLSECSEKFYVFIAVNYYEEIEEFLRKNNYHTIKDYLYFIYEFNHKPIEVENIENYRDIYGNQVTGNLNGGKVIFNSFNSKLIVGEECDAKGVTINFYNNGEFRIGKKFKGGYDLKINVYSNKSIIIKNNCTIGRSGIVSIYGSMELGDNSVIGNNSSIQVYGSMRLENNCIIDFNSMLFVGDRSILNIKKNCTMGRNVWIYVGKFSNVNIGEDCMFSRFVSIMSYDSHPIFDVKTKKLINKSESTVIGNHVWMGIKSTALKGTHIGNGSIIGANSVINGMIPNNCIDAGIPGCILRKNVAWDRSIMESEKIQNKTYWNITK